MQVLYDPQADRLRWQLRTFGGELFAVWLTRRTMLELWPQKVSCTGRTYPECACANEMLR